MNENRNAISARLGITESDVAGYMSYVFFWMFIGLLATTVVAVFCAGNEAVLDFIFSSQYVFYGIFGAQLLLVIGFSAGLGKMNTFVAKVLFLLYSVLTGITFSTLFLVYELNSLVYVFGITTVMFASLAIYGILTKKDMTRIGTLAVFGLFAIIVASLVNSFLLHSAMIDTAITYVGIVVFLILIAYDTQKIKNFYLDAVADENSYDDTARTELMSKIAIFGAFALYLDFINLFLKLLRVLGKRKN